MTHGVPMGIMTHRVPKHDFQKRVLKSCPKIQRRESLRARCICSAPSAGAARSTWACSASCRSCASWAGRSRPWRAAWSTWAARTARAPSAPTSRPRCATRATASACSHRRTWYAPAAPLSPSPRPWPPVCTPPVLSAAFARRWCRPTALGARPGDDCHRRAASRRG